MWTGPAGVRPRWPLAVLLLGLLGCSKNAVNDTAEAPQVCALIEEGALFAITPYLHNVTTTTAEVLFATTTAQDGLQVRVAPRGAEGCAVALRGGAQFPARRAADDPADLFLYRADLSYPAAAEDRRLCYGIELGGQLHCEADRDFVAPGTAGDSFSFFVYGDSRAPFPAPDRRPVVNVAHQEVAAAMLTRLEADRRRGEAPASFLFAGGDFAYCGCELDYWRYNYFTPAGPLLGRLPIYTSPGNHEYEHDHCPRCPDAALYQRFFPRPAAGEVRVGPGQLYSFDRHNVRVISLRLIHYDDPGCCISWQPHAGKDCPADPGGAPPGADPWCSPTGCRSCTADEPCCLRDGSAAWDWLTAQLTEAQRDDAIDHVLVFHHAPLLCAPPADIGHPTSAFQVRTLAPLLERPDGASPGKVAAVFNSHNHFYERSVPLRGLRLGGPAPTGVPAGFRFPAIAFDADAEHGISYLVAGGGGADLYPTPRDDPGQGVTFPLGGWLAAARSARHYVKITVDGPNLCGEAVFLDGSPTDRFTLRGSCP